MSRNVLLKVVADSPHNKRYQMDKRFVADSMIRDAMNHPGYKKFTAADGTVLAIDEHTLNTRMTDLALCNAIRGAVLQKGGTTVKDADVSLGFVLTTLTYLEQQTFFAQMLPDDYRELFSEKGGIPTGANTIQQRTAQLIGQAQRIATPNGGDIPAASVQYDSIDRPIMRGGVMYEYSYHDLEAAAMTGIPLQADTMMSAKVAYERHLNIAMFYGKYASSRYAGAINFDPTSYDMTYANTRDTVLEGAVVNSRVPVYTLSTAAAGGWNAAGASTDLIRRNIDELLTKVWISSALQVSSIPNTVLIPASYLTLLNAPYIAVGGYGGGNLSVGKYLMENNIYTLTTKQPLKIIPHWTMDNIYTAGGNTTRRRIMAYSNDAMNVNFALPMPLHFLAPQYNQLKVQVYGTYKYSEVWWTYPMTAGYADVA